MSRPNRRWPHKSASAEVLVTRTARNAQRVILHSVAGVARMDHPRAVPASERFAFCGDLVSIDGSRGEEGKGVASRFGSIYGKPAGPIARAPLQSCHRADHSGNEAPLT